MKDNSTTVSINLDDMSLDQIVQLSQGLGHQAEKIREQRRYLNAKIAQRLAAGERNAAPDAGDAQAPGAVIDAAAKA